MLPNRIKLSQKATDKLRSMKAGTGLTPNILSRIAIMLAINDNNGLANVGIDELDGQELNQSVLFGEHILVYDVMINQFIHEHKLEMPVARVIASLVEIGIHKVGHVKKTEDLCQFI
jgi:DNA sulfur modification protein DndE